MSPTIVAEISRQDLGFLDTPSTAVISEVTLLSSYNWVEAPTPTIAVPGSPHLWSPPAPRRLPKDSGLVYIAQNAARHPESPLEPLFRSLYISNPSFDIRSTDVISDRNNVRKLLSFIDSTSSRDGLIEFTIKIELVGDTVMLCRDEVKTYDVIGPDEFRGFGHEFEKVYTTSRVKGSTGHYRIISYRFGGLTFIIRHETDGFVDNLPSNADHLSSLISALSLSSANAPSLPAGPGSKLTVKKDGQIVSLESTLEIKTRAHHKPLPFAEAAAQLWVSQTPKLVRAYHKSGTFQPPTVEDVGSKISKWENDNQGHLRKLSGLLSKVLRVVKAGGKGGNWTLKYDSSGDKLVIWKIEDQKMLPDDLYAKWAGVERSSAETDTNTPTTHALTPVQSRNNPPFFDIIEYSLAKGYRHFFRRMPLSLRDYRVLYESLERLGVDVLGQQNISNVMADFRTGANNYDHYERRRIPGQKSVARDAANDPNSRIGDKNKAYNATLFVVSHSAIFRYKTRKIVREAFDESFDISAKQRASLDKWAVALPTGGAASEGDATTESEGYFDFDSDFDWD
ncbi:uncharacterized protein DNG_04506 [Cephalotrichum gorgonifer]|uniref:Geranylgeranyl pyrophosphate synthetase n=1 Tax=Cephalotrichum gorgonifer TaxID=2041049 RepID=A0AAE8MX61_9PEZI|nr:uncharacterized protein DNG_04506 [Cephalotrichum gorgonifer]